MNLLVAIAIIVDASGHGNFTSVQAAINSLAPDSTAPGHILVKNGVYNEKIFIEKDIIVLEGEDREKTIVTFALARDVWRCEHESDWGVATLNLRGSDITLKNLTIQNTYGYDNPEPHITIHCGDSAKTVRRDGHQMAVRSFETTRLKAVNCIFKAYGGDTMSPWNVNAGLFYFKDCTFTGYDGFKLGRYHRDAQFYLINCHFAANMADQDIYLVPTENIIRWGRRIYYNACDKPGKPYPWYADNLTIDPKSITPAWLFHDKWDPERTESAADNNGKN